MSDPRADRALRTQGRVWLALVVLSITPAGVGLLLPPQPEPMEEATRVLLLALFGAIAAMDLGLSFLLPARLFRAANRSQADPVQLLVIRSILANALCAGGAVLLGAGFVIARAPSFLTLLVVPAVGLLAHRPSRERNLEWLRALDRPAR